MQNSTIHELQTLKQFMMRHMIIDSQQDGILCHYKGDIRTDRKYYACRSRGQDKMQSSHKLKEWA
jgi:hypothetical protein